MPLACCRWHLPPCRKAPGSVDMRAALAALLWEAGREAEAEGEWGFACTAIATGCKKYQDGDWLSRIRWGLCSLQACWGRLQVACTA